MDLKDMLLYLLSCMVFRDTAKDDQQSCRCIYQPKRRAVSVAISLTRRLRGARHGPATRSTPLYLFNTTRLAFTKRSFIAAPDPDAFFPDQHDVDGDEEVMCYHSTIQRSKFHWIDQCRSTMRCSRAGWRLRMGHMSWTMRQGVCLWT